MSPAPTGRVSSGAAASEGLEVAALPAAGLKAVRIPPRPQLSRQSRRDMLGQTVLLAADVAAAATALAFIRLDSSAVLAPAAVALPVLLVVLAKMAGLYEQERRLVHKATLDETPALVAVAAIFALLVYGLSGWWLHGQPSRSQELLLWGEVALALIALRAVARLAAIRLAAPERVIVIGDSAAAKLVRRKLQAAQPATGVVIGRVSSDQAPASDGLGERVLGSVEELSELLDLHAIDRVVIGPGWGPEDDVLRTIRLLRSERVKVTVVPRLLEVTGSSVGFDDVGGYVALSLRGFGLTPSSRIVKRALDLGVASLALILLSPVMVAAALAIRLTSPGPVLFRQRRIGPGGRQFRIFKFRTMVVGADARKEELLALNEAASLFKIANDPRATRVGRRLRQTSIDELPQLFNVLRGEMSIVGPRPLQVDEDQLISGWQRSRYVLRPGITGPWQVRGASRIPFADMVMMDYLYCANWSPWLDAKLILRTVLYVLARRSGEHNPTQL